MAGGCAAEWGDGRGGRVRPEVLPFSPRVEVRGGVHVCMIDFACVCVCECLTTCACCVCGGGKQRGGVNGHRGY